MEASDMPKHDRVGRALIVVTLLVVASAALSLLIFNTDVETIENIGIGISIIGGIFLTIFLILLPWHFVVSIRGRHFKKLLLHLVSVPACAGATYVNVITVGLTLAFRGG